MTVDVKVPSPIQRWLMASRPKTLPAALSPVIAGGCLAFFSARAGGMEFRWLPLLLAALAAVLIQIGANLVNDVVDYLHGTDDAQRLGPTRVTQSGLLTPRQVWGGVAVVFGLAGLCGIYLSLVGGLPILLAGVACILAGMAYSTGPFPLSKNGWGDLFAFLFFGIVGVCGTVYLGVGSLTTAAWLTGAGIGALVTNILIVNNIRDIDSDRRAGRHNIPIRFGRRGGQIEYALMLAVAFLVPLAIYLQGPHPRWVLLVYPALPYAVMVYRRIVRTPIGRAFNLLLAETARLVLIYAVLLGLGFVLSAL